MKILKSLCILFYAALLTGCISHQPRCIAPEDRLRVWQGGEDIAPHSVSVVEFDDHGEFWDIHQLASAVQELDRLEKNHPQGVLTITFIHGWQANPSWEEGRLVWFKELVENIAKRTAEVAQEEGIKPQPVAGVFIGWRGGSTTWPLLKHATFWNRKMVARQVASLNMNETLVSVTGRSNGNPASKCIVIGHSLGGQILERSIGPLLCDNLLDYDKEIELDHAINLTVIVNPAGEALHTKQLVDFMKRRNVRSYRIDKNGNREPLDFPAMVLLSSENDVVSKAMFPFGQGVSAMFFKYRKYDDPEIPHQRYFTTHTAGFVPYLISHNAFYDEDGTYRIEPVPDRYNDTPLWIINMEKEISAGHSDIDNDVFLRFLGHLMRKADIYDPDSTIRISQDDKLPTMDTSIPQEVLDLKKPVVW